MIDPITDAELAEFRALADGATSGPWVQGFVTGRCHMEHRHDGKACVYDYTITRDSEAECQHVSIAPNVTLIGSDDNGSILSTPDAAFIAASRSAVPRLLDLIAHQRAALRGKTFSGESPVVVEAERDELRREVERLRAIVDGLRDCPDAACQRGGHSTGLHMSRTWDSFNCTEIIDEWSDVNAEQLAMAVTENKETP